MGRVDEGPIHIEEARKDIICVLIQFEIRDAHSLAMKNGWPHDCKGKVQDRLPETNNHYLPLLISLDLPVSGAVLCRS